MKDVMFNKADLLYLKPYSEQAEQLETECLRACDVITIVTMFTIVAINHKGRNTNHDCRTKPQLRPQLSQSAQPQGRNFSKKILIL